jgi:hypothetical protein
MGPQGPVPHHPPHHPSVSSFATPVVIHPPISMGPQGPVPHHPPHHPSVSSSATPVVIHPPISMGPQGPVPHHPPHHPSVSSSATPVVIHPHILIVVVPSGCICPHILISPLVIVSFTTSMYVSFFLFLISFFLFLILFHLFILFVFNIKLINKCLLKKVELKTMFKKRNFLMK